jgi:hypothetical protein
MPDLIYTRRPDAQPLTFDNIVRLAPAAFTEGAHPDTSDRYKAVSTLDAMSILQDYGYMPVQAAQRQSRKDGAKGFTQHMLAFAHKWNLLDRDRPEIILYNSHDGKSSLRLYAGMFRGICSNGLVAGDGFEGRMRHLQSSTGDFMDMLEDVAHTIPKMSEKVSKMKEVQLGVQDAFAFAERAAGLRWDALPDDAEDTCNKGELRGVYYDRRTAATLLTERRVDDYGYDLWRVFNRAQESLIRGGGSLISFSDSNPYGRRRKSRPVGNVADSIKINRSLWDLANEVLEAA